MPWVMYILTIILSIIVFIAESAVLRYSMAFIGIMCYIGGKLLEWGNS
jgi:hypothetical protein